MSPKQIVLDPDIQSLQDEGLRVEVVKGHLLVHAVPYVNDCREVAYGTLITEMSGDRGAHQVWIAGDIPHRANGTPFKALNRTEGPRELWQGFTAHHRFSNKPTDQPDFPKSLSVKMRHYIALFAAEAKAINPDATPYVFDPVASFEPESVFHYWDFASTRVGILGISEKLALSRVAIIGLGGTGGYVLDLVSKTFVREIHLFDGDLFEQHSAFRAPGAASLDDIEVKSKKVEYFAGRYGKMHKGIVPHPTYLDEENLSELDGFDFAFLCVDKVGVRKLIADYLIAAGTPFIDTGMELTVQTDKNAIMGTCRATLCTPAKSDHFERRAPIKSGGGDDIYRSNIQVADMNMINAAIAVQAWKKYCEFYCDHWQPHNFTFSIDTHSLTCDEHLNLPPNDENPESHA